MNLTFFGGVFCVVSGTNKSYAPADIVTLVVAYDAWRAVSATVSYASYHNAQRQSI